MESRVDLDLLRARRGQEVRAAGLLVILCFLIGAGPGDASLRAAILFKLSSYVEWPEDVLGDTFCFSVLGDSALREHLSDLAKGKSLHGRPVTVTNTPGCPVLYSSGTGADPALGVLTVGTNAGFARSGGMLELVRDGSRIGFEINTGRATAAGLKFSSKILKLAKAVHRGD